MAFGEKYYGSNASTFVGGAAILLGSVSVATSWVTGGDVQILSAGGNAVAGALLTASVAAIGIQLIKSREWIGGVVSIALTAVVLTTGAISIDWGSFFRVLAATSEAVGSIDINVNTASAPKSEWAKVRELSPDEQAECAAGTADWTKTPAGKRNCTGGGVYRRGG